MSLKDTALEEATLKALADKVNDLLKDARARTQAGLDEAEKDSGIRQIAVTLPDGTIVGSISLTNGTAEARVTDERAFTAWVVATYPSEVDRRFVTDVRQAFTDRLLKEMTAANAAKVVDRETGEIHDVPGVEIRPARRRTHSVRLKGTKGAEGAAAIEAAWQSGGLALPGITSPRQLEAGGDA